VAAAGGEGDLLTGDGVHTVAELVERANLDPSRGAGPRHVLTTLVLDEISLELLRKQGLTPKSVPATGRAVLIHYNGDLTVDVTDRLSPEIAASCVLAARTVGLDIAGMDIIAEDIGRSLESQSGAVIEVNASPSLLMHLKPLQGKPRPVGEAIVDHMFGPAQTGRVPLVAVVGTGSGDAVTSLVGRLLAAAGYETGQVDGQGVRVGDHWLERGDVRRGAGSRRLLMNPFANAFVFGLTDRSILEEGLAFDRCQVAVVTDVGVPAHDAALDGPSHAWRALRCAVDVVLPNGFAVLNADDPNVVSMAGHCKGKVIYFAHSAASPSVARHLAEGGTAVVAEDGRAVLYHGASRVEILDTDALSVARTPGLTVTLQNWLAAIGASLALGMTVEAVKSGFFREFGGRSAAQPEREAAGVATVG
jgi:cyanophycin synthetase